MINSPYAVEDLTKQNYGIVGENPEFRVFPIPLYPPFPPGRGDAKRFLHQ